MGHCAGMLLYAEGPNGIVTLVQKLGRSDARESQKRTTVP